MLANIIQDGLYRRHCPHGRPPRSLLPRDQGAQETQEGEEEQEKQEGRGG